VQTFIFLVTHDISHLVGTAYVVEAVVIASSQEAAKDVLIAAVAAEADPSQDELPLCERERLTVSRLGTVTADVSSEFPRPKAVCIRYGQDDDC